MSGFSQTITPAGDPNILWKAQAAGDAQYTNQLLNQGRQMDLTAADHEQVARLSAALLNEPDLAKRGDLYARGVGMLQSQNLAKYAPATLPDESTLRMLAAQGVSSEKQYEYGAGRTAAQGALGALGISGTGTGTGTTAAAPAGSVATAPSGTIEPAAFNNATAVRDGLIKRGMDPDAATGAAANALHESVANPRTGRGDNGNAAGIFMWTGPRLQAYINKTGHPPDGSPLDEQLDFLMDEWKGSEASAAAKVAEAQGPAAKAAAFSQYFLRPKDTQGEMQRRSATAMQLQQQIGGGGTQTATAPAGGGGTPGRVQVASVTPTTATDGTTAPPGSTAAPAATTAPASTTPVPAPQVPLEPLLDLKPSGLTAQQEAAAKVAFSQPMTPAQATALTAHYQQLAAANVTANHTAAQTNFERQRQAAADVDTQQARKDAAAKAAREAAAAAQTEKEPLFQGQGTDIQDFHLLRYADPKSDEYHQAYARQATPKTLGDGVTVYPNMSAYRMPLDQDGAPITTYDQVKFTLGPGNLGELRKLETQASGLTAALDDFASTAKKASFAEKAATLGGASTDLRSAWTNAGLMAKGEALFNLGVLSGPDMAVIRGALADPSTFIGAMASSDTIDKQVNRIKRLLETRIDQARRSYGGGQSSAATPAASATTPPERPPLSSFQK